MCYTPQISHFQISNLPKFDIPGHVASEVGIVK